MKRTHLTCVLLALALTGCGGKKADMPATKPDREETTMLEISVEGQPEQVPAALYIGEGYSIYIPQEGWWLETDTDDGVKEETWESMVNDEVELHVLRYEAYPDATAAATKADFVAKSGYVFEDLMGGSLGDPLTGVDEEGDFLSFMAAEGQEGVTYVVAWEYPAQAAEGFGARLARIAGTFQVTA